LNSYEYFTYTLEPFYNGLLNTDKIVHKITEIKADTVIAASKVAKPKALGLILENTLNTNEENTQHEHIHTNMKRYADAVLIHVVKAPPARSDGHGYIHATRRSDQPRTNGKRALRRTGHRLGSFPALILARADNRQGIAGRTLFSFLLSIKKMVKIIGLGILRKNFSSKKASSLSYSTY